MKTLALDVDGVLLDFESTFIRWCKSKQYIDILCKQDRTTCWNYSDMLYPEYSSVLGKLIGQFFTSDQGKTLPSLINPNILHQISNLDVDIHVITQVTPHPNRVTRVNWLTSLYGGVFKQIHFTSHGQSKMGVVKTLPQLIGFVEDKSSTILEGVENGLPMYGARTTYNVDIKDVCVKYDTTQKVLEHIRNGLI